MDPAGLFAVIYVQTAHMEGGDEFVRVMGLTGGAVFLAGDEANMAQFGGPCGSAARSHLDYPVAPTLALLLRYSMVSLTVFCFRKPLSALWRAASLEHVFISSAYRSIWTG